MVDVVEPMMKTVGSPYVYFGGKSKVADIVWERIGDVGTYIEPFFGSGAVLLLRPSDPSFEIANDIDGFVANFWRAVKHDVESVVDHANSYVHEVDLHAKHRWTHNRTDFIEKMKADPEYYDATIAGIWVWGMASWIGNAWSVPNKCNTIPNITGFNGIHKQEIRGASNNQPVGGEKQNMLRYFEALYQRIRHVKFCCGDWSRVVTGGVIGKCTGKFTGVFCDPPYPSTDRTDVYANEDYDVAHKVRAWAIENGNNPNLRIALCGYSGEHDMPDGWDCVYWKADGGFGNQSKTKENLNRKRERIWFSPSCLQPCLF